VLRGAESPVLVAANKVDEPGSDHLAAEVHRLGVGEVWPVSAIHGHGTGDMLDALVGILDGLEPRGAGPSEDAIGIAIIGRPNVGKSSLLNALVGSERVIVSDVPGTTRDAIDVELEHEGRRLRMIDTAGLRRRTKVAGTVGFYAQLRSERAADRADVAILLTDATEGIRTEDLRIGELAMKSGSATLVALNKWDISTTDLEDARARVTKRMRQRPPLMTCSALTGRNLDSLLRNAVALADKRAVRIATPELNRFVADVVGRTPPPSVRGRRLRLYYAAQIGERPPRFAIQVNNRGLIKRDWAFHLENRLREQYGFEGVPLVIDYKPKSRSRSERR
ncbi:MAG: ribosome biogenesis GTPase Der, partial [Solirubrobacterales bacterium]